MDFEFRDLPPGPIEVLLTTTLGEQAKTAQIVSGGTTEVSIEVP